MVQILKPSETSVASEAFPSSGQAAADRQGQVGLEPPDLDRLVHELRTPLAAIQSTAEALAGGHLGAIDARHAAYLESIRETARHAIAVVEAMLVRGRSAEPDQRHMPNRVDLRGAAADVVAAMATLAARAGVRLQVDAGADTVLALARPTDVRQMLINLVSNGLAHAGSGATIQLSVGSDGGDTVWLEVADDGPGIRPGIIELLEAGAPLDAAADPSFASRVRLGLSVTRSLAVANRGWLQLTSGATGTRARLVLPAA